MSNVKWHVFKKGEFSVRTVSLIVFFNGNRSWSIWCWWINRPCHYLNNEVNYILLFLFELLRGLRVVTWVCFFWNSMALGCYFLRRIKEVGRIEHILSEQKVSQFAVLIMIFTHLFLHYVFEHFVSNLVISRRGYQSIREFGYNLQGRVSTSCVSTQVLARLL